MYLRGNLYNSWNPPPVHKVTLLTTTARTRNFPSWRNTWEYSQLRYSPSIWCCREKRERQTGKTHLRNKHHAIKIHPGQCVLIGWEHCEKKHANLLSIRCQSLKCDHKLIINTDDKDCNTDNIYSFVVISHWVLTPPSFTPHSTCRNM